MKYKYIPGITSDVMFEAYGKTPKELFENAAEAMFSIICKLDKIELKKTLRLKAAGQDMEDLFYNWLQKLIAKVDTDEMFFSKFNIIKLTDTALEAEISGEPISPAKGGTLVKAVSYHDFDIKKKRTDYAATVTLDI